MMTAVGQLERAGTSSQTAPHLDIHIDDQIPSRPYRRVHHGEA